MSKIIVISSGKGGVGKTTTAVNLAAGLNYHGKSALVIDGNLTTPNVGIHFGSPEVPVTLNHLISGKADLGEVIYEHESGVKVIPASLSVKELKNIDYKKVKNLKKGLKGSADYIIIDSAAGLGEEATSIIDLADELIIVTNPEMAAITDALKAIRLTSDSKKTIRGIIVTRVRKDKIELQPDVVKGMLEAPILGMVPEHLTIKESWNLRDAVVHTHPKSPTARAYKEIAAELAGVEYDSESEREKLLERFLKKIKLKK